MQIFVAHAKEDQAWAKWIKRNVEEIFSGAKVYISPDDVTPGEPTWPATLQAIDQSSAFISLISQHYFQSNAREEVGYAFRTAMDKRMKILPVIIDSAIADPSRWPAMIKHLRPINFARNPQQAQHELWRRISELKFQEDTGKIIGGSILLAVGLWLLYQGGST